MESGGVGRWEMRLGNELPAREPDLLVLLNEHAERDTDTYVEGPADWVIEIVSPESGARDRGTKFDEYERGGVSEYWIIDPHRRELWAYRRGEDGLYQSLPVDEEGRVTSVTLPSRTFVLKLRCSGRPPCPACTPALRLCGKCWRIEQRTAHCSLRFTRFGLCFPQRLGERIQQLVAGEALVVEALAAQVRLKDAIHFHQRRDRLRH